MIINPPSANNRRVMRKYESVLVLNDNTIFHQDYGRVISMLKHYGGKNIFLPQYEYLGTLNDIQFANELAMVYDGPDSIISEEFLGYEPTPEEIFDNCVCTDFRLSMVNNPSYKWVVLTGKTPYDPFKVETLYRNRIDLSTILKIVEKDSITGIVISNINLMALLMNKLTETTFIIPNLRKIYTSDDMNEIKNNTTISKLEIENRHELILYDMYGQAREKSILG